jgi:hypothetical protein
MVIKFYECDNGTLILGTGPLNVSAQVRACRVTCSENVTRTDAKKVLSGEELPATERASYTFQLTGTLLQDPEAAGVVDWSWDEKGTEQNFVFSPNDSEDRGVQGILRPIPLDFGGDVGDTSPESDFTWSIVGTPVLGVFDPVEDDVTEDV